MRPRFDDETEANISAKLPDPESLWRRILPINPDVVAFPFEPGDRVPLAAPCLNDTATVLNEARFALEEAYVRLVWHRVKSPDAPNEYAAVFFGRFYACDVALRLYAAGEHLANAIIHLLELDFDKIERDAEKKRCSLQSLVAKTLQQNMSDHRVSTLVATLGQSPEWKKVMDVRNRWVHHQPPMVSGYGLVFMRGTSWKEFETEKGKGHELTVGGGDEPEYTIDELVEFTRAASSRFSETLDGILTTYVQILSGHGLKISDSGRSVLHI